MMSTKKRMKKRKFHVTKPYNADDLYCIKGVFP